MNVVHFGNATSIHVHRWRDLFHGAGLPFRGYTIHAPTSCDQSIWHHVGAPNGALGYGLAGLLVRRQIDAEVLVHAHNASGYGLMAYLSGRPYIVTVYGSEIYTADKRGRTYRFLLKRVLSHASHVTCTTPAMRDLIRMRFGLPPERISTFSLGIPTNVFYWSSEDRQRTREALGWNNDIVILSNRRMQPQYRIDLLVRATAELVRRSMRYRLVLLEGDADRRYAADIRELVASLGLEPYTYVIDGMRTQADIADLLRASDIAVSIPTSDQLSASILEALACGALVATAELPAYEELLASGTVAPVSTASAARLADSLERLADIAVRPPDARPGFARSLAEIASVHSDAAVTKHVMALYDVVKTER